MDKNLTESLKWTRVAVEKGDAMAMYHLGWCYEHGEGVEKDANEADKWYRKAAENGIARRRLKETVEGMEWTYSIKDGNVQLDYASTTNATGAISIPSTLGGYPVTSIRGRQYGQPGVFEKCCTSMTIPSSVTNIGNNAFSCRRTGLLGGTGRSRLIARGNEFCEFNGLESFSVAADNPSYSSRNGMLCTKDGSVLIAGVNGDVVIPECVTNIGRGAFVGCGSLKSVTIPDSVKSICEDAFFGCSALTTVTISKSVTSIGSHAFDGCSALTSVTIPDGVSSIGDSAFSGCTNLTSVMIGNGVTSIGNYAFYNCGGLTSVTILDSVTNIDSQAFYGCTNLASVDVVKEGKVERVSFQDFCKQRKLSGAEGSLRERGLRRVPSGGSLRERRALREQARQEELAKEKELEAKRRAEAAAKEEEREKEREAQRQAEREEQRRELEALKAELRAQRVAAEKARKARETAELEVEP